jgi:hypothetical protein
MVVAIPDNLPTGGTGVEISMTTSKPWRPARLAAFACLSAGLWTAAPAHASLGDIAAPIAGATTRTIAGGAARVLSYAGAGGTTINVYVNAANNAIFAYSWQGPVMPHLQTLLGRYYESYRSGVAAVPAGQRGLLRSSHIERPDVVVGTGGQMRSYVGRAWLPTALPAGVREGDVR